MDFREHNLYDKLEKTVLLKASSTVEEMVGANEEATKIHLVLPFIINLGYDIFSPSEVIPEYKPQFYTGNDRVDFALCEDYSPRILIEVKGIESKLGKREVNWLAKYFNSEPSVKVGILTNGVRYMFFTDSKYENIMDNVPFYEFNLGRYLNIDEYIVDYFSKRNFNYQSVDNSIKTIKNAHKLYKSYHSKYLNDESFTIEELYNESDVDLDYLPYDLGKTLVNLW